MMNDVAVEGLDQSNDALKQGFRNLINGLREMFRDENNEIKFRKIIFFHAVIVSFCFLSMCYVVVKFVISSVLSLQKCIYFLESRWFLGFHNFFKRYLMKLFCEKNRLDYDAESVIRGDTYVDKMLEMFGNKGVYDPYYLEDCAIGYHKQVVFVSLNCEAKLHDGYIKGFNTLHRVDDCSLNNEGNKLKVRADIGAGQLEFHFKGSVKIMNFGPTVTIIGTISCTEVFMEFDVNSETGKDGRLISFVINDMRGLNLSVSGLGFLNWVVNPFMSLIIKVFDGLVQNFMELKIEKHINESMPNYQFHIKTEASEAPEETT